MILEYWIIIYLFINGALCFLGGTDDWGPFTPENICKALIGAGFAMPIVVVLLVCEGIHAASKWLDGLVQFRTYWRYVFARHRLLVEDHDTIQNLYEFGLKRMATNSIRHRLWRHAQSLIHKVNGFKPKA